MFGGVSILGFGVILLVGPWLWQHATDNCGGCGTSKFEVGGLITLYVYIYIYISYRYVVPPVYPLYLSLPHALLDLEFFAPLLKLERLHRA